MKKLIILVFILLTILISGCTQSSSLLPSQPHIDFGKFELGFITLSGSDGSLVLSIKNKESYPLIVTSATANLDGNDITWTFVNDYRNSTYIPSGEIRSPQGIVTSGKWIVHNSDSDTYSMNLTIYYKFNGQDLSSSAIVS